MTPPPPHPHSWTPWPAPSLEMMFGRLAERSDQTIRMLDRIDRRLEEGDSRMDRMGEDIATLKARQEQAEQKAAQAALPGWEKGIKQIVPYLLVGGTMMATGSVDAGLKLLSALGGK